jgi:hypothetical protein
MKLPIFDFVEATSVRRAVVADGDIRGDIGFQNDINVMLARLDDANPGLQALGWVREPVVETRRGGGRHRIAERVLRAVDGGTGRAKGGVATFRRVGASRSA